MQAINKIDVQWQEDGSAVLLARVCADDATGAATGVPGEGNWIKQADLTSIGIKVFDLSGTTPDTATVDTTQTISDVIVDTPVTTSTLWTKDYTGFNYKARLPYGYFPTANRVYRIEIRFVTTGDSRWTCVWEGPAFGVKGS